MERQLAELDALTALLTEGDFEACWEDVALIRSALSDTSTLEHMPMLSCVIRVAVEGVGSASISAELPQEYPDAPARIALSCVDLELPSAETQQILTALKSTAAKAASCGREVLFELATECRELATTLALDRQHQRAAIVSSDDIGAANLPASAPEARGLRIVWFHHIKSSDKRKRIVKMARDACLGGFSKPGFPGVVVVSGQEDACAHYVEALRELRWQAMDVRWEEVSPMTAAGPCMPTPFRELGESAMGEAAALCDAAGIGAAFRTSVLKLRCNSGDAMPRSALPGADASGSNGGADVVPHPDVGTGTSTWTFARHLAEPYHTS